MKCLSDFFNKEYVDYSSYSTLRMLASCIDGQKNAQRKIITTIINNNIKKDIKVSQLNSKMAMETEYLHGDSSGVISKIAQEFPGTNNLPLLGKEGNFGTRLKNDPSAPRYIYVYGNNFLFSVMNKEDKNILIKQYFENNEIEPMFYLPAMPLILVNGSEGLASGFAQKIFSRNYDELKDKLIEKINNKNVDFNEMLPYYNNFNGTIEKIEDKKFIIKGKIHRISSTKIEIQELPVGIELKAYLKILKRLKDEKFITKFLDKSENTFKFEIFFNRGVLDKYTDEELLYKLKLTKIVTENYTTIDKENKVRVFKDLNELMDYYFNVKVEFLRKRISYIIDKITSEIKKLVSIYKFVSLIVNGELSLQNKTRKEIENIIDKNEHILKINNTYDYIFNIKFSSFTKEKIGKLKEEIKEKHNELKYKTTTPQKEWLKDIANIVID